MMTVRALALGALLALVACVRPASAGMGGSEPDSAALLDVSGIALAVSPWMPHVADLAARAEDATRARPPRFAFLYEDPLGERVDTIAGMVTKWLGPGRDTTIALRLTDDEVEVVYRKMLPIRDFEWPGNGASRWWQGSGSQLHDLPPEALRGRGDWAILYARSDTMITRVEWPWFMRFSLREGSDDMLRLQQLVNLVWFEVAKHPGYRDLPRARYPTYW